MSQLLELHETVVIEEWVDSFGHMNLANYVAVCDQSTFAFWELVNGNTTQAQREGEEYAVVETHVNYLREVRLGDALKVTTQLLGADEKRFRIFHTMINVADDSVAATNEIMGLGFDLNTRNLSPFNMEVQQRMQGLLEQHAKIPVPKNAGRGIIMQRNSS